MTLPREQSLIIILADISGYTRFMLENQTAAVHGQQCITFLIETLLREVDIPLRLQEIEGDAVFLYAAREGDEAAWRQALAEVRAKLPRFFAAFLEGMSLAAEATPCSCAVCRDSGTLKLKLIVHSGRAVFHAIGGRALVSGADVILAHRLLKNSVPGDEYLLMTEAAYRDLGRDMGGEFLAGEEHCGDFGTVKTYVRHMGAQWEHAREALYALPAPALGSRARLYVAGGIYGEYRATLRHLLRPASKAGVMRRAAFALWRFLLLPAELAYYLAVIPRRLRSRRARR
ncbi:MAG: DUF2652 domain-containing protein [Betaproteobacteria bacterium]|nr:DUF2652 domain-containing protein [Betaproteobacteria bacterium]MDH5349364.1 DUF2652 domain-containing protein [Betaproteobacteria bacterium]